MKQPGTRLTGVRVLVVEDHPDTLETLMILLEANGAEVAGVLSTADALPALVTFRPDLLLADIAMPGEDGFALITKVRKARPVEGGRIPALALSAHVYPEDQERALAAGFQAFLDKPVSAETLLRAVRTALEGLSPVERRRGERRSLALGGAVLERRTRRRRQAYGNAPTF